MFTYTSPHSLSPFKYLFYFVTDTLLPVIISFILILLSKEIEDPEAFNWSLHREQKLQKEILDIRKVFYLIVNVFQ